MANNDEELVDGYMTTRPSRYVNEMASTFRRAGPRLGILSYLNAGDVGAEETSHGLPAPCSQ